MIVVDLGCAPHGGVDSTAILIKRFKPDRLYGFDPLAESGSGRDGDTTVLIFAGAAWTHDGAVLFQDDTVASCIVTDEPEPVLHEAMRLDPKPARLVSCFDLASWLLRVRERVILKMDIEGAEYTLLPRLIETGAIALIDLLLIEWHWEPIEGLPCPVENWPH